MNKTLKFLSFILLCGFSMFQQGCSKSAADVDTIIRLNDGVMSIPVLPGSFLTNNCGSITKNFEGLEYACIAFPMDSEGVNGKDWDTDYSKALTADGWFFSGGEANVYFFEKPFDSDCSHKLAMIGWYQGTPEQEKNYSETGRLEGVENMTFIFSVEDDVVCGKNRKTDIFK